MGINGRHTVANSLQNEYIVGSPDMTPSAIRAEAQKSGVASSVKEWPTKSVANQKIDTGAKARLMAQYMRIHTLEATHGFTYAQMGIWAAKPGTPKAQLMPGGGTDNSEFAAIDPTTKAPISNSARQIWVTETALTTALNTSYMASQLGLFGIVVGIALLLSGRCAVHELGGVTDPAVATWLLEIRERLLAASTSEDEHAMRTVFHQLLNDSSE